MVVVVVVVVVVVMVVCVCVISIILCKYIILKLKTLLYVIKIQI